MSDRICAVQFCTHRSHARKMCITHYSRWRIANPHLVGPAPGTVSRRDRYQTKVQVLGPDECWPWKNARDRQGYGQFDGTVATRTGWELEHGEPPPSGMLVCHHCDNPSCCNPAHWFLGTAKENHDDMVNKGRRTSTGPAQKLTDTEVLAIKLSLTGRRGEQKEIAMRHGVSRALINRIARHGYRVRA